MQIEAAGPLLLLASQRSGVPIEMPVEIAAGTARIDVTGEHERVAAFGEQLRELGLEFDVEHV